MNALLGRNHRRELLGQYVRERLRYKPSIYGSFYDPVKVIFVHIPKCAGTSISVALYGGSPWHWTAADLYRINPRKYREYFKFCVVRNPWDRLYSAYQYAAVDVKKFGQSPLDFICHFPTFEAFVLGGLTQDIAARHYFIGHQVNFLRLPSGEPDRDIAIGRFEELTTFMKDLQERLPDLIDIGHENASKKKSQLLSDVYSREMIEHVGYLYEPDINEFGYEFPS